MPMTINWFVNPTAVARSMGLDIDLPDLDNEDPVYRQRVTRDWRRALVGKIDMTASEISRWDPDWVRLKRFGDTVEVWFDLEEGIVFRCLAWEIHRAASFIRELAVRFQLPVSGMRTGTVVAQQCIIGNGFPSEKELRSYLEAAGFRSSAGIRWTFVDGESVQSVRVVGS